MLPALKLYTTSVSVFLPNVTLKGGLDYQSVVNYQVGALETVVSSIWAGAERPRFVSVAFTLYQFL